VKAAFADELVAVCALSSGGRLCRSACADDLPLRAHVSSFSFETAAAHGLKADYFAAEQMVTSSPRAPKNKEIVPQLIF